MIFYAANIFAIWVGIASLLLISMNLWLGCVIALICFFMPAIIRLAHIPQIQAWYEPFYTVRPLFWFSAAGLSLCGIVISVFDLSIPWPMNFSNSVTWGNDHIREISLLFLNALIAAIVSFSFLMSLLDCDVVTNNDIVNIPFPTIMATLFVTWCVFGFTDIASGFGMPWAIIIKLSIETVLTLACAAGWAFWLRFLTAKILRV